MAKELKISFVIRKLNELGGKQGIGGTIDIVAEPCCRYESPAVYTGHLANNTDAATSSWRHLFLIVIKQK